LFWRQTAAAKILDVPTVVTEQYPKALGHTVPEIDVTHARVFPKTRFSMCVPDVMAANPGREHVVLYGIEVGPLPS
jgi:hypothetical protein